MYDNRMAWEKAEELAPEMAAECGLAEVTPRALWRMHLSIYKYLLGRITWRLAAQQIMRYARQSRRDAASGQRALRIVQA